jgi:hypothetical protein
MPESARVYSQCGVQQSIHDAHSQARRPTLGGQFYVVLMKPFFFVEFDLDPREGAWATQMFHRGSTEAHAMGDEALEMQGKFDADVF